MFYGLLLGLFLQPDALQQRFDRLMRDILILDAHVDTPRYVVDEGYRLADEHPYYEADIPRLKRGKIGAVFFGIYAQPQDYPPQTWIPRALECIDAAHEEVRGNSKDVEFAYTAADIERIHKSGKTAVLLSLEGGHMIADSLRVLRDYYRLGIRYMTLAHFKTNNWADSGTDVAVHNGLSTFGRDVVREMNRLGMIVDVSHVSDKTVFDALETSRAPVIASHSSVKAICDIPRNMPDAVLRAIGVKGGVVCINFHAGYLNKAAYDVYIRNRERRDKEIADLMAVNQGNPRRWEMVRAIQQRYYREMPKVSWKEILRHIDHVVKVAGVDHVGIGSDYDGVSGMVPDGLESVAKHPLLVRGLMEMGYSDADIRKVMGQNVVRVLREAEAAAAARSGGQ